MIVNSVCVLAGIVIGVVLMAVFIAGKDDGDA